MLYILDQDANLPLFSFHLHVCSYRFLQERSLMIPMQEQHRLVEKAVYPFLRARLRRSSHRGDKVQMIFDPCQTFSWKPVPFSVFPGHGLSADYPRIPGRKKKNSATLGTLFMEKSRNELLISRGNDFFFFFYRYVKN